MKRSHLMFTWFLAGILFLTACSSAVEATPPDDQPDNPSGDEDPQTYPYPSSNEVFLPVTGSEPAYPAPEMDVQVEPYPGVEEVPGVADPDQMLKFSDLSPLVSDKNLSSGPVFIDSTDLIMKESDPVQVELSIYGNLPTPCHQLRVVVSAPDANNQIAIHAYSVSNPDAMCIQVLEPFQTSIPLDDLPNGDFTVFLNSEKVTEFSLP